MACHRCRTQQSQALPDFRPVLFTVGILLIALSAAMLLPAAVDALRDDPDWQAFAWSAGMTGAIGGALMLGYRQPQTSLTRSEEHTSELQSLMRISYAVFCLKKKNKQQI